MDNNETNKLPKKTVLEETLNEAAKLTAVPSKPGKIKPAKATAAPGKKPAKVREKKVATIPVTQPDVEAAEPAEKTKRTLKAKAEKSEVVKTKVVRTKKTTVKEVVTEAPAAIKNPVKRKTAKAKPAVAPEQVVEQVVSVETPSAVAPVEPATAPARKREPKPEATAPATRQEVIDQLRVLITKSDNEIKEKIDFLKQTFYKLQKAENEAEKGVQTEETTELTEETDAPVSDPLETVMKELLNDWREKRAERIAEQDKQRMQNLEKKLQIVENIRLLTESTEDIGRTLPEFRRLQQTWKEVGNVPQEQVNEVWKKYQMQVERFYDLLKINNEFREYDFKKNLEIKVALCENAEKLTEEADVVIAFRQLQKLHEDWRETGPVAKDIREDIWNRFKSASSIINKNHQHFFERLKTAETENLAQKTAICEVVEAIDLSQLKSYKDWDAKTAEIIQLQEQWKSIGFAPKKVNNKVFDRFRSACDVFFRQKSEFYKASKDLLNQNLEKKRLLCEKAELLKDSTDWKTSSDVLIRLQKEWKSIGPVPKKFSDSIWKRFIAACDYFFEQKEKFAPNQRNEEMKNLTAKKELIAQLETIPDDMPQEEALKLYRELIAKWNVLGHVPFREKDSIYKAWHDALDKLTERLNISKENRRLNKFQQNLDDMNNKGQGKVLHERERLLRQFDSLSTEIKTAENNIGFFSLSKSSDNSLLDEITQKIEALKEERDLIYKKIKLIDEQL